MGIFFQPDMNKARQLSPAMAASVLYPDSHDEEASADPDSVAPFDFFFFIKELKSIDPSLKGLSPRL